jgi:hypothetical protein
MFTLRLHALLLISFLVTASASSAELYVSLKGNDKNPGTKEKPLLTLEGARDAIRAERKQKGLPKGGVTVYLRGGTYKRTATFTLSKQDSGTATSPIRYCSVKGETVRIIGGVRLPASKASTVKDKAILARIPASARAKVRVLDLAGVKGIQPPGLSGHAMHYMERNTKYRKGAPASEVFFNDKPLTLARWPNKGFSKVGKIVAQGDTIRYWDDDYKTHKVYVPKNKRKDPPAAFAFQLNNARVARWETATDLMLLGYWHNNFSDQVVQVARTDGKSKTIYSVQPSCYGIRSGKRFYAFNLLEELDAPGEWYIDHKKSKLYFYPPNDDSNATVSITLFGDPLFSLKHVSHVTLNGLTFSDTRGVGIAIEDGSHVAVEGCSMLAIGKTAVSIKKGSNHRVANCEIAYVGEAGIRANGGDVPNLTPAKHTIENNHIHHFARLLRTYQPGIGLNGVGIRVANNEIAHAPHVAILFGGNDHVIEKNFIHNVVQEAEDMGALYAGRSWFSRGTIIRNNLFKDIVGFRKDGSHYVKGVYLDDGISGIHITGNIFLNIRQGVMVNGGRDNHIEHNLFIDCDKMMRGTDMSSAYKGWAKAGWGTLNKNLKASPYKTPAWRGRYPGLDSILNEDPQFPKGNVVSDNACYKTPVIMGKKGIHESFKKVSTVKNNPALKQSPGRFDSKQNRFMLTATPELKKMCPGTTKIPFLEIGLQGTAGSKARKVTKP